MKRDSFNVLFFLKKAKLLKNGEAAVCMRVTVNRRRVETNIRKSIDPKLWNQAKECSRARDKKSLDLNNYIEKARIRLRQIFDEFEIAGIQITADLLIQRFYGQDEDNRRTLLNTFKEHNEQCRKLIGIDYAAITISRYDLCSQYLGELIKQKYNRDDLLLKEVNGEFVRSFEFYMKTEKGCQQNTVIRYMKCFKKITNLALANDWITKDPFFGIKFQEKEVIKEILTKEELTVLMQKEFAFSRLELVRDVFIFCCFTGLAFVDASQLKPEHIVKDNKGEYWIRKARQKTKNMCNVPLLEIPRILINKYKDHPEANKKGLCLPVPANQKMNSYLKEIADLCGINKVITTHTARHTFASVVMLANDVSIENVAKMLGHSDTRMTQHYAKVLDSSIMRDMQKVKANFNI